MQKQPEHDPQRREHPDPHERGYPIPWPVLGVAGLVLAWAVCYILTTQRSDDPALGDQRTIATLQGKAPGAAGSVGGAQIYAAQCVACHQATGAGLAGVFPPLAGSEWVAGNDKVLVNILLHGVSGKMTVKGAIYSGAMPAFKEKLGDAEIAAVLSHIRSNFGNSGGKITAELVKAEREAGKDRVQPWNGDEELATVK